MKRKRARLQTAQERFSELFAGDERLWSRLFGHIQGDLHVTKKGDMTALGTACEAHGEEMAPRLFKAFMIGVASAGEGRLNVLASA